MKKCFLSLVLLATVVNALSGKNRVIEHPSYEVKSSGIYNVAKIELSEADTRIYVKTTFIPGWWVKFPSNTFIQPQGSTEKILATGIEKGEFDKEIHMPASGDSLFVLVFPPLDKSIKKIDYGEDDKTIIFGVSLEKNKAKSTKVHDGIPAEIASWLNAELEEAEKKKSFTDFKTDVFFSNQPARLIGYIKGYDPRLGFSTGMIYMGNEITREDFPITINIHSDGRFEAILPMQYPVKPYSVINDRPLNFYIEPGHTLGMVLDWEEFLIADRQRNIRYTFKDIKYMGALADINRELLAANLKEMDWREREGKFKTLSPEEYKAHEWEILCENKDYINQHVSNEKAARLLENTVLMTYGTNLLEYSDAYSRRIKENPDSQPPLTDDYYDFLQHIPMNEQSLLCVSNASVFINRFEYCRPFGSIRIFAFSSNDSLVQFIKNVRKNNWTQEDDSIIEAWQQISRVYHEDEEIDHEKNQIARNAFYERFGEEAAKFSHNQYVERCKKEFLLRDSVYSNVLELPTPSLLYDIVKVRELDFAFKSIFPEAKDAYEHLLKTNKSIRNPFLIAEATRVYEKRFPSDDATTYNLPDTEPGALFREMITPLKGKYIIVDFWESSCGPCIYGIKNNKPLRDNLKDGNDVAFLFICSEETPQDIYDQYVDEQDLENSYRLTKDQYNRMRELFKFNGIPHYEYIDREGRVMTKGLDIYSLETSINEILKEERLGM